MSTCNCGMCAAYRYIEERFGAAFQVSLSEDGEKAAFVRLHEECSELWVVELRSGQSAMLFRAECEDNVLHPAISPDGNRIAFSLVGRQSGLHVAEGRTISRVTDWIDLSPTWVGETMIRVTRVDPVQRTMSLIDLQRMPKLRGAH